MGTILKNLATGQAFRFLMSIPTVSHGVAYLLEHLDTGLVRFERELSGYVKHEDQTLGGPFDPNPEEQAPAPAPVPGPAPEAPAGLGSESAPPAGSAPEVPAGVGPAPAPAPAPSEAQEQASDLPPLGG